MRIDCIKGIFLGLLLVSASAFANFAADFPPAFTTIMGTLDGNSKDLTPETKTVNCPRDTRIVFAAVNYARADAPLAPGPNEQICACGMSKEGLVITQILQHTHKGKVCGCMGLCIADWWR